MSGDLHLLKHATSFTVPGARFSKLYRDKKWDGRVSLIKRNKIPVGLIPYIIGVANRRSVDVSMSAFGEAVDDQWLMREIVKGPGIDADQLSHILDNLPHDREPRYYQTDALHAALDLSRSLIVMPTGSGKSLTMYMLSTLLSFTLDTVLIIVPRIDLVDQMAADFRSYSNGLCDPICSTVNGLEGTRMLNPRRKIFISTFQSWFSWCENLIPIEPSAIIFDEAHTVAKKGMPWKFMDILRTTKYRYGFTATEPEQIYDRLVLQGLVGPTAYRDKPESRIEDGTLARPLIKRVTLHHADKFDSRMVTSTPSRMQTVVDFIDQTISGSTALLILTEAVDREIMPLVSLMNECLADTDILYLTRVAKSQEREAVKAIVGSPRRRTVLCATYGLFQMGINIPSLAHVLMYSSSRSHIRVLQSIGRVMRPKERCYVYDMIDVYGDGVNDMAERRMSIYEDAYGSQFDTEDVHLVCN